MGRGASLSAGSVSRCFAVGWECVEVLRCRLGVCRIVVEFLDGFCVIFFWCMVWLVYLIRSFVCMDILGASGSEAFSIFVTVKVLKIRFMGFLCFLCMV